METGTIDVRVRHRANMRYHTRVEFVIAIPADKIPPANGYALRLTLGNVHGQERYVPMHERGKMHVEDGGGDGVDIGLFMDTRFGITYTEAYMTTAGPRQMIVLINTTVVSSGQYLITEQKQRSRAAFCMQKWHCFVHVGVEEEETGAVFAEGRTSPDLLLDNGRRKRKSKDDADVMPIGRKRICAAPATTPLPFDHVSRGHKPASSDPASDDTEHEARRVPCALDLLAALATGPSDGRA